jgi:conjugal transfer pilus assembly protein TraK
MSKLPAYVLLLCLVGPTLAAEDGDPPGTGATPTPATPPAKTPAAPRGPIIHTVVGGPPATAAQAPALQPAVLSQPDRDEEFGGVELPTVSHAVLRGGNLGNGGARAWKVTDRGESDGQSVLALGPKTVKVSPGTTTILEVAKGHLNRIITPFASPAVRTVSSAQTQVDGNVVYVASGEDEPVTLYISDSGNPDTAVALTLAPRNIPPREIRLDLAGAPGFTRVSSVQGGGAVSAGGGSIGTAGQPYVEGIVEAFRAIARNQVPAGFGLTASAREGVRCSQYGLSVTRGQVLDGTRLRIYTGVLRNTSGGALDIEERTCTAPGTAVAAVATWPRVHLAPGEETEVYVAMRPHDPERERRDRPSLLGRRR